MEIRENNVELKAMGLVQEFIKKFRSMDFTIHPANIPGESAGKGSNMAWAVRKLSEKYSMETRKDVIVTGIDGTFSRGRSQFWLLVVHPVCICMDSYMIGN